MDPNDHRSRTRGAYKSIVYYAPNVGASGSIGTGGKRNSFDEEVSSFRGKRGAKLTFDRVHNGKRSRMRVTEPNGFGLVRTYNPRSETVVKIPRWRGITNNVCYYTGPICDVQWGSAAKSALQQMSFELPPAASRASINQAFAKANSPLFAGATQLVEAAEAVQMLYDLGSIAVTYVLKTLRAYCQKRKILIQDITLEDLSQWWLLYRYGLRPTVLSAYELIAALGASVKTKPEAVSSSTDWKDEDVTAVSGAYGAWWNLKATRTQTNRVAAYTTLYCYFKRDAQPFGFGSYDWVLAGWEKLKFSFIVDWFVNVGSWLAAYRPGSALVKWSYCSVLQWHEIKYKIDSFTYPWVPSDNCTVQGGDYHLEEFRMERLTNVHPSLFPAWDFESWEITRQIDAIALAWGVLTGSLKWLRP